ncbi:MAG: tandem-95 repeat protein [Anaerolineaceae bacterium]|nr:tandem-95 repeat protein [Anaerolineaceae bacterium]
MAFVTVPAVRADLPPETYYQGLDTGVNGDDEGSAALPIGFNFNFYGNTYNQFYVASNGMITFTDYRSTVAWGNWPYYVNKNIPSSSWPNNYIAPFWDDVTVENSLDQRILYKTIGTAPNRMLVVQYTNVGFWNDPTPLGTFFIILYEGSNNIQFQYRYLVGDNVRAHGASATVGLENAGGTKGTQYSFDTQSLDSEQVILFTPGGNNSYAIATDSYEPVLLGLGTTPTPDIPVQTSPLKGATVSTTPAFSWGAAENATSYEIRVDNNANMGSLEIHETGITGTSFTPASPLAEGTYYWIVIAHNADDQAWSRQWNFTVSNNPPPPLPGVPLLVAPDQDAVEVSLTPTFSWQAASDADEYQLIVSEQPDLSTPLIDESGILTTSFAANGLTADTLYYWSVIASNMTGSTQSSVRSFTSLHINKVPTASDDTTTVAEDSGTTAVDVLANDTDPDTGDTLSITSVGTPGEGGTAVILNNQINYTPAANFFGSESFTYTMNDGHGGSDSATVTITVTAVNDTPTASDDTTTVAEDSDTTAVDVLANDTDLDTGDTLSITSVGTPGEGGTAVILNNQISYTPAANFFGSESFTYTMNDGHGGSDTATVTIEVTPVNDMPTANNDYEATTENSNAIQINVLANDTDPDVSDVLSIFSVETPDNGGTAVILNNQIHYTPAANFFGSESFTYTMTDGQGGSDTATVTVEVTEVNDAPTASDDSKTVAEDSSTITLDVLSNDSDPNAGDTLVITLVGMPDNGGTAELNNNQIDYTPTLNFFGTETFTYTISDSQGESDTAIVTIEVTEVNDAPVALDDNETISEDSLTIQIDVLANDLDPDAADNLTVTAVSPTDHGGTAVINNNLIDYTPALNFFGTETFTYTIGDSRGGSSIATVTIEVITVNDAPTANDDNATATEESGTILIDVLANDEDVDVGDVLTITLVSTPDNGGTAVLNNDQIAYTPASGFVGTEAFTYTISDGHGGSDTAVVTLTIYVSHTNAAPNAYDDSLETLEDSSVIIDVLDNDDDPDGDSLSILNVSEAAHGTAVIQGNRIKYTPDANFHGTDSFTYTVSDGEFTDVATINITIVSVNDRPQTVADAAVTNAGSPVVICVLDNDSDPVENNRLTVVSVSNPAHGTATTNGTTVTYKPDAGFVGTETFIYTISDGTDLVTGMITITVNAYQLFIPLIIK